MAVDLTRKSSRTRIRRVLEWVEWQMPRGVVRAKSQKELISVFGNLAMPLAHTLKPLVLEEADPYFNRHTGRCKKYRRNEAGIATLKQIAGIGPKWEPQLPTELEQELTWGTFEYQEKSNRDFHPLQFVPTKRRERILKKFGYQHFYDINSAAISLLRQNAVFSQGAQDFDHLADYVKWKDLVRSDIAQEAEATTDQVKLVINALLQGSVLTTYLESRLFCDLNYDYALVRRLQASPTLTKIRSDIQRLWRTLRPTFDLPQGVRLSARMKSARYRELEQLVMRSIKKYMKKHHSGARSFWIHDGWATSEWINIDHLSAHVMKETRYIIDVNYDIRSTNALFEIDYDR